MTESFLASLDEEQRAAFIDGLFNLSRNGHVDELREMIESGVPLDVTNARGDSLLIVAAYAQQPAIVDLLLGLGARTDVVNAMGQTAISCAVFRNDKEILEKLLATGADPNLGAHPALAIAQQFGISEMIEILSN